MEKLSKIGRYEFLAEPFHCDFSNHLFMGHLGNHMLNAADFHSNDRGYGMNYLNTVNKTWVLSRLAIEMEEMPKAYDKFFVETWVDSALKSFTSRNFKVIGETGHVYGYGKSVWAMIDLDTRQPADILAVRSIDTYYNDVDINGHINAVKYIEHVLDLWDVAWYKQHRIKRFEIAYVAESHQGDKLHFYREQRETETDFNVRITKSNVEGEETEVCRCRVKFG